VFTKGFD
jgi:hypothetical protein